MTLRARRRWLGFVLVTFVLIVIAFAGFGTYLAGEAGRLPWQVEPTRIAITPFATLPATSTPAPVGTPGAGT